MGRLSKRMKRLLAVLLVEVIVAGNVFVSYADEQDEPFSITEEELVEEYGSVDEGIAAFSDDSYVEEGSYDEDASYEEDADSEEEVTEQAEEEVTEQAEEVSEGTESTESDENLDDQDSTDEKASDNNAEEPVVLECTCDVKCAADEYNADCPVCSKAVDAEDAESFLEDNCKGEAKEEQPEEPDEKKEIEPEIVKVDNSVSVTAVCKADGEAIEGTESLEIEVNGTVDVLEKAPEIEGYTFTEKAVIEDGGEISRLMKETAEEKEETEVDGEKVVTKITETTSMSYYDGNQWTELDKDIVIVFEYTQDEETDEENASEVKFIASFVDQDGNAIEGYTSKTLTFDDTLDLTKEPVAIENYTYVEARINDAVVTSFNKKTETDEEGEEVTAYSYTADGEEVEVTENTEVTLIYEGEETAVETVITLACVDEEGLAIEGYEKTELPEFEAELALGDPEKAPVEIEGYDYKEAAIDGVVITALVKETSEESADEESEEEAVAVYSYVTEGGETVLIEEDTEIKLSYEEAEVAVMLDATIVDEFGDEIAEKYTNMDISKIFDKNDELTLDDPEMPPVKKVSVRQSLFKTIKYTYVKASVDNEIITGLKRKAMESEDAKASDAEYAYSYTTDGETWKKIKEDTTVIFEYSDGKKTTYTYEDSFVSVTATLQHANAIPDDAEFVVTPVTPSTSGYNYDAYMEALNANADQIGDSDKSSDKSAKAYTEDNTLLYDIAFLAEQIDEDGNAVEGSKVEYQPAEGMVKISFVFKQKQLEEDLNAEKAADVTVVHMPLADSVKESVDTTADATGISAGDVNVEVVSASTSVTAEVVDFSLSNFSVSAFVADGLKAMKPGASVSIEDVLGEAIYYGIVANEMKLVGHMESNFATGLLHGDAQIQSCKNDGGGAGETFIGAYDGSNFQMTLNGNEGALKIYTTEDAMRRFGFNMTHLNDAGSSLENLQFPSGVIIDYTTYSESEIKNKVSGMVNSVAAKSAVLKANGDNAGYEYSEIKNEYANVIDIAALGTEDTGTYYVNFKEGEFPVSGYTIKIKSGQNVVLNIPDSSVQFGQFTLEIDGKRYTTQGNSGEEIVPEKVIFNCPNATSARTSGATDGTFIVPNAAFANDSVAAGFLVANTISNIGGQEWHAISKRIPIVNPTSFVLHASKTVNGQAPATEENGKFTFTLSSVADDGAETVIETVTNNGGAVEFTRFDNIRNPGTYWYKIQESGIVGDAGDYSIDSTVYYAKVVVSSATNGMITDTNAKVIYYKDSQDGQEIGAPVFNNIKEERGSIVVSKAVIGKTTDESFYFTLTGSNGAVTNEDGSLAVYEIKAGGSVRVDGLVFDTYTLAETDVNGSPVSFENGFAYKVTYSSQNITVNSKEVQTAAITNTFETTSVSGRKTWDDSNNQDGKRPESITIRLWADEVEVRNETVTAGTGWSWNFTNLPKYADGKAINYTITEDPVANYTTQVDGYDVINTHESEKTEVSGSKTWNDNDNQDGKRPTSITINLLANGKKVDSKEVTAEDSWSWTFDSLDKYAGGQEITYTITEDEVADYTTKVDGYNVENTHAPGKTSVNGSKTWKDNGNQDGKRPESITIRLWADGKEVQNKVVTKEDGWSWNFENLDKYANGKEIKYTITEDAVKDYTTVVSGYSVINTHETEKTFVNGSKTWNDNDDQDGIRPDSITINLYADGELYDSQTVTEGTNWSWSFTELDKYAGGKEIKYTITEDRVDGYEMPVVRGYNVENTHTPEKTEVSGRKTWNDNDNQDGKRPTSITINLLANGKKVNSKTVTEADGWSWTFDNLDKYANGTEINYTITEEKVDDYTTEVNGYDVVNTHAPGKTSVNGSKTWNDNNNQDGKRPASITIRLWADGKEVQNKVVTEANNWSWTFDGLDEYANGKEIKYTVTEDAVTDYTTVVSGYNVINTHNPEETFVSGSKTWTDADN
ncbi:MAG: Cna B-type domain-containing protein, partial [Lachnospiraceae bacterium]|nr:Cna B-type domain-containing protein [Lachnospiraceae bacterium]